jgi:hypothetical protein
LTNPKQAGWLSWVLLLVSVAAVGCGSVAVWQVARLRQSIDTQSKERAEQRQVVDQRLERMRGVVEELERRAKKE